MSKKFDKKLQEMEDWLDDFSDALDDEGVFGCFSGN